MGKGQQAFSDEQRIFAARIADLQKISEKSRSPMYSGFLADWEQTLAQQLLGNAPYSFWGGYEQGVRRMLCVGTADDEDFPIAVITFIYRRCDSLSHRDFLGAIMNLGVKRETIGDILVGEGSAVVFVEKHLEEHISEQIDKIGRVGVRAEKGITVPLPQPRFEEINGVVASVRLDSVAAAMCGQSREKTSRLISSGMVQIGGLVCTNASRQLCEGETVSIRGSGKYTLKKIGAVTKKGKFHIEIQKFM